MKAKELREKSIGERAKMLLDLEDQKRKLRFDLATREAKNHSAYGKIKKSIAQLLTLNREEQPKNS